MSGFWKTWMIVWCWGVVAFGAVLAFAAVPAASGGARFVYALVGGDQWSEAALDQAPMQFAIGLQGALTIGWALTMLGMVRAADAGGVAVWRSLTTAVLVWYVIDSAISVMTGFPLNAVSNTALLATYLAPVLGSGVLRAGRRTAAA